MARVTPGSLIINTTPPGTLVAGNVTINAACTLERDWVDQGRLVTSVHLLMKDTSDPLAGWQHIDENTKCKTTECLPWNILGFATGGKETITFRSFPIQIPGEYIFAALDDSDYRKTGLTDVDSYDASRISITSPITVVPRIIIEEGDTNSVKILAIPTGSTISVNGMYVGQDVYTSLSSRDGGTPTFTIEHAGYTSQTFSYRMTIPNDTKVIELIPCTGGVCGLTITTPKPAACAGGDIGCMITQNLPLVAVGVIALFLLTQKRSGGRGGSGGNGRGHPRGGDL